MIRYSYTGNIKAALFVLGIVLIGSLLFYTQSLVDRLRKDNREIVKLYSEIIADAVADQDNTNLDFIFENIIKKIQFPIIQSDAQKQPQSWKNFPDKIVSKEQVNKIIKTMDRQNPPIPLVYTNDKTGEELLFGYLHYGDSKLIGNLRWLPYYEIGAVALFILLGFAGFSMIRNSEKQHIWVGLARETAHQLGTPVSALMGWVDWLKAHPEKSSEIVGEIENDLQRLQQVSERFNKMGSRTDLSEINISESIEDVISYLKRRLPTMKKNIELINEIEPGVTITAHGILMSWAIENIVKNGINAIERGKGWIRIQLKKEKQQVRILISDNGKGIPRRDWKNVFRPGFSTRDAGWGLGLSLTQRIIRDIHGGKVRIAESTVGSGTTFEIILPQ